MCLPGSLDYTTLDADPARLGSMGPAWRMLTPGTILVGVANDFPFVLAGKPARSADLLTVRSPFDGSAAGQTWLAGDAEFDMAADAAVAAAPIMRALPAYERAAVLMRTSAELVQRKEEIARTLAAEAGKPLKDALIETDRAAMTFHVAADEARRPAGDVVPMDLAPHGAGRLAIVKRVPIGPVAAISPFNFPLNLTAHKMWIQPAFLYKVGIIKKHCSSICCNEQVTISQNKIII